MDTNSLLPSDARTHQTVKLAGGLTILWLLLWPLFSLCSLSDWSCTHALVPNAWGDWMAGFAAPLAFLWLFVGTWLQRIQAQANFRALQHEFDKSAQEETRHASKVYHDEGLAALTRAYADFAEVLDEKGRPLRSERRWSHVARVIKTAQSFQQLITDDAYAKSYQLHLTTFQSQLAAFLQLPYSFDREYFGGVDSMRHYIALDPRAVATVFRFAQGGASNGPQVQDEPLDIENTAGEEDLGAGGYAVFLSDYARLEKERRDLNAENNRQPAK